MPEQSHPTRFRRLSPIAARLALLVLVAVTSILVAVALGLSEPPRREGISDLDLYEQVVNRLRAGEAYYPALHQAMLDGGYGTLSVFNWRPPAYLWLLSLFPSLLWMQLINGLVMLAGGALAVWLCYRQAGRGAAVALAVLLCLSLMTVLAPRAALSFELVAGGLILLSVAAYGLNLRWLGFIAAGLALFLRELAAIPVLIAVFMAWRERRAIELTCWLGVLAAYGCYFYWHAMMVQSLLGPADHAAAEGWLQFGFLGFVLRTASFNGLFVVLPYWVTALLLPLALLGLSGWRGGTRALAIVAGYVLLYCVAGRPVNGYWGALYTPLLMLGLPWVPMALRDLLKAAQWWKRG